jgi:hypothetical protein
MASVLNYIDVVITREIETVSRTGFGTLLFIGTSEDTETPGDPKQGSIVAEYADLDAVEEVFSESDPEYLAAQAYFSQEEKPDKIFIGFCGDDDYATALNDIVDQEDDWYAVAIESRDSAQIEAVAANINARYKLFLAATDEAGVLDPADDTDIASTLLDNNYDRTALFYHSEAATEFPECALAGLMLPKDPGSATWAWKTLAGIPSDSLTSTERGALEEKRCAYYVKVAGNNITFEGQTSRPGVFIDIIRGQDWLTFRLAEDMVARLTAVDKIPYIGGDAVIESIIRERLDIAVDRNVIDEDYTVTVPPASEQQSTDRADRIYRDVTFRANLIGAVHKVEIRGTLVV